MLNVSASIIIPPNIQIDTPNKYLVPIPIGQLSRVLISFPYGAGWLVGVSLWYQNFPLLPIHRDTWIKGNDYTFDLHSTRNLNQDPFEIEVRGYNLDTVFQHEILFVFEINERIGLSDVEKQTIQFMSQFSEILITSEGGMAEISSPLHVSTKVLTRPDYMTGVDTIVSQVNDLGNSGITLRFTYTVPTGKRAFVDIIRAGHSHNVAGFTLTTYVNFKIGGNSQTMFLKNTDPAAPAKDWDITYVVKMYLNEGDSVEFYTANPSATNVVFTEIMRYYEFTPTQ